LLGDGFRAFVEVSPHPVLTMALQEIFDATSGVDGGGTCGVGTGEGSVAIGSLRRDDGGPRRFLLSLGEAWAVGTQIDWEGVLGGGPADVALPPYAFSRKRYWPHTFGGSGDPASLGLMSAEHPLLAASTALAGGGGWLLTGRLSLDSHAWLADHAASEAAVLPSAVYVELALQAAARAGCDTIERLSIDVPLVLEPDTPIQLQVALGAAEESGARSLSIHSRPCSQEDSGGWIGHATGVALPAAEDRPRACPALSEGTAWPPPDAESVSLEDLHERLAQLGWEHGPAFDGLRAAWRRGGELFAEVSVTDDCDRQDGGFALDPALLDAALQLTAWSVADGGSADGPQLACRWDGVRLHSASSSGLRVAIAPAEDGGFSLSAANQLGVPVLSVDALRLEAIAPERLARGGADARRSPHHVQWQELALEPQPSCERRWALLDPDGGEAHALLGLSRTTEQCPIFGDLQSLLAGAGGGLAPAVVLANCCSAVPQDPQEMPQAAHASAHRALALVQQWLAAEPLSNALLVILTRGAASPAGGERVPGLCDAPIWGLVRSAQLENPDRLALIDLDPDGGTWSELSGAVALIADGEPQLAIREGRAYAPRLVRGGAGEGSPSALPGAGEGLAARSCAGEPPPPVRSGAGGPSSAARPGDAIRARIPHDGTVLITGGTGGLGSLVARHLVQAHGVRSLLLASLRGASAAGAGELQQALGALGAQAQVVACDVSDRDQLARLIDSIPAERPLKAVVHAAGALDDALIAALTPARIDSAMNAKVDGAWHLHTLTRGLELDAFVLFSSLAGVAGAAGQASYAAANAFLDALAAHRRAEGLPASSMAWGWWEQATGLTGRLSRGDLTRLRRMGMAPMSAEEGLALMDAAWKDSQALTVPVRFDSAMLRRAARSVAIAPLLRGLVPASLGARHLQRSPLDDLRQRPLAERRRAVLEIVRVEVAGVLGHASAQAIDDRLAFRELGFDSLLAVELRNRLAAICGVRLPSTLVFDYPTPALLTEQLLKRLELSTGAAGESEAHMSRTAVGASEASASGAGAVARVARTDAEEPVAIVGMACRYPGDAHSPQRLWELLIGQRDAISQLPGDREWDLKSLYATEHGRAACAHALEGGFLHDLADFDAEFFGISPREAVTIDPQQRLMLEASWEAFEDAAIVPASLRGTPTGVFVGTSLQDYGVRAYGGGDADGYRIAGSSASFLSGRIAYVMGFEGPAISIDTACSSSLVALHLACAALRAGECPLAVVGGVGVLSTPLVIAEFARQGGLAADGRCKAFADAADGTNWGEGAGVLVVERLSDAQRRGHEVLALVRASAVNQDGASNGITAPNGPSQQRVIRQALANAGLSAAEIDVVEGHGTGTRLGDPIELQALLETYGRERPAERPLWLGSIKSNIGHTQAAAGVAGLIKMTLALRHGVLPKTLHAQTPSTHVDWSSGALALLNEPQPWTSNGRPRRAGVSAFGISGTNAHVILEEAPCALRSGQPAPKEETPYKLPGGGAAPEATREGEEPQPVVHAWTLSGRSREALLAQAALLHRFVETDKSLDAVDVGLSLALRPTFEQRAVVIGAERKELLSGLAALAQGRVASGTIEGAAVRDGGQVAFMFSGQGAQRAQMGVGLYRSFPVYKAALEEVCAHLEEHLEQSVLDVLLAAPETPTAQLLDGTMFAQAGLFALELALVRLLEDWGVRPSHVAGHSIGELTAACVAGVLSLSDACRLVAARGRLMAELPCGGAMVAVQASFEEMAQSLRTADAGVAVAAVNGPRSVVLSGEEHAVLALAESWRSKRRKVKRLGVSHAFHSPHVDDMLEAFGAVARQLSFAEPQLPVVSGLTGRLVSQELCSPDYWVRQVRETVRFADAVGSLSEQGVASFLEVGPDGALSAMATECLQDADRRRSEPEAISEAIATLAPGRPETGSLALALARLWTRGAAVDWRAQPQRLGARRLRLPTYPFRRRRYWMASEEPAASRSAPGAEELRFLETIEREDVDELARMLQLDGPAESDSLRGLAPALSAWRLRSRERSAIERWRYRVEWKPLALSSEPAPPAHWLAVLPPDAERHRWIAQARNALQEHGMTLLCAQAPRRGEQAGGLAAVAPRREERAGAFAAAVREALAELPDGAQLGGVLSLLAVDEASDSQHPSVSAGLADNVALTQALLDVELPAAPLWMLTRGAVSVGAADPLVSAVQAQTWGLGLAVGLEQPRLWGGVIDLPQQLDERSVALLASAIRAGHEDKLQAGHEDQLAIRPTGAFARRVARAASLHETPEGRWRAPAGTALISGGTGGLGAHVARWLAEAGAERLVLLSRRGERAPGAHELAERLRATGTHVEVLAGDVADRAWLAGVVEALPDSSPLSVVVHAAGIGEHAGVEQLDADRLQRTLTGKVQGALNLDALTREMQPSAFVLFSSIAATFGSGNQGAYAAANATLDALAFQRRACGCHALSLAWGPWQGEGMATMADGQAVEVLRRRGLECMAPELAIKALQEALLADETALAVADVRWEAYAPAFASARRRPLIEDLPDVAELSTPGQAPTQPAVEVRGRLLELSDEERVRAVAELVRVEVARVLAQPSAERIDVDRSFKEQGFDSLLAVELRNRLVAVTGVDVPATLVFDYPTPREVVDWLLAQLGGGEQDGSLLEDLSRLERRLLALGDGRPPDAVRSRLAALLGSLERRSQRAAGSEQSERLAVSEQIGSASDEEIFGFIDRELG
jgi:acyl transferase domain-containing protein/acyl carrier protein